MRKWILVLLLTLVVFVSCEKVPNDGAVVPVEQAGITAYEVELLFSLDGVSVYRFFDKGEMRYFTIGNGSFQPQIQKRTRSNGKVSTTERWSDGAESR